MVHGVLPRTLARFYERTDSQTGRGLQAIPAQFSVSGPFQLGIEIPGSIL